MSRTRCTRIRLLLLLAACSLTIAGTTATTAGAAPYGELSRFGKNGKGAGAFTPSSNVHALGVDPTDNSVYVGDEPKEGEFRIQKFTSEGTLVASVAVKFKEVDRITGLQGLAVDPTLKRVYALVVYERLGEEEGGKVDLEEHAAGVLYALSTVESGKELVPAAGAPAGVLASKEVLHAQSETINNPSEAALLEPAGITVDPKTGDVVILGQEDRGGKLLAAAQRLHSNGTLGARWVDTTECFEGEGSPACTDREGGSVGAVPNSPVVTAGGRVLVTLDSGIWEIPSSFTPGQAPKVIFGFGNPLQNLIEFPGTPEPAEGAAMAYEHEAGEGENEGMIFVTASIVREIQKTRQHMPGAMQIKLTEGAGAIKAAEVGWTGGVNHTEHEGCAINIFGTPSIGVGTKQKLFLFDSAIPSPAEELEGKSKNPHVDVFGPTGSNCPTATATAPIATVGSTEVGTESSPIVAGQKVALSSKLTQANALSVEWNFGDGTAPVTETGYQYEASRTEHAFTAPGTRTVKETIHTDNLAEPSIVKEAKMVVAAASPTAQFSGPGEVAPGQPATFDGKGSSDPNGKPIVKYVWTFGDGTEATTATPSVSHTYSAEGTFTVSLKVTDELLLTSAAVKRAITVAKPSSSPTTTTPPPPATSPAPPPGQGVLPSQEQKAPPLAKLASSALTVSASGGVPVKVSCPAGASCAGTVTLTTIGAVSASRSARDSRRKIVLTLASGSFTVGGGATKMLTLHLSAKARKLLAKAHTLRAKATVVAHDPSGARRTTVSTVTLKLAKKSARH
jgi:PKD repeat protein